MSNLFGVPVDAAYHLVSGLTGILTPVLGGPAAVAAIVAFTMAVRLLLMPLSLRALRGQAAQARLAPQMLALLTSVAGASRATAALPMIRRASALREKSWRAAFLRQRDPDAAGRSRPRAPSAAQAAVISR